MYTKFSILIFVFCLLGTTLKSQWTNIRESQLALRSNQERGIVPEKYETFQLNNASFDYILQYAPVEREDYRDQQFIQVSIPMPNGDFENFEIHEAPLMEAPLAAKYPNIKSYKGRSVTDHTKIIRFSFTSYGFNACIRTREGDIYIDPYFIGDNEFYISYYTKYDTNNPYKGVPLCGVDDTPRSDFNAFMPMNRNMENEEVEMRVYRYAVACTGEWGKKRLTVERCLMDINTMLNRLNQIYESEMAIRFILVADNDKLIFLDPDTDPYTGSDVARTIINQNTPIVNNLIGANNYEIGHVMSVCFDVGGVAALGSACQSNKANGVTCNNDFNLTYAVASIMSHEVGHQWSASHTMNSCAPSQENVSPGTGYEPGSGTTIMSYSNLCGIDNVINASNDEYFHVASLEQMFFKTLPTGNAYACAQKIQTGNTIPTLTMPAGGFVIPIGTPFELTAIATDNENDNMTYCWEQYDLGPQSTLGSPLGNAPLFRSFPPNPSPTRFFPTKENLLKNQLNNKTEVIPTTTRPLTFKCTVRDNNPAGLGVVWDEVKFSSTASAGPFRLTFPFLDGKFKVGDAITVTWDVANTDKAPVNCKKVNIYLSLNDELITGHENLILLASEVPNDGSEAVIIPNNVSNKARFVVKAADNIFLSASVLASIIEMPIEPSLYMDVDQKRVKFCLPTNPVFNFTTEGLSGLTENIQFEVVSGLPTGAVAIFSNTSVAPGEGTQLTLNMDGVSGTQIAEVVVRAFVPGGDFLERTLFLDITSTDLSGVVGLTPDNGLTGGGVLPAFTWSAKVDATQYQLQLATNPAFEANSLIFDRTVSGTNAVSSVILEKAKVYYWRVRSMNECAEGAWSEINAFSTEVLTCTELNSGELSINISASGRPTIETGLNFTIDGIVNDLNVKKIRGDHQRNGDLIVKLVSPANKEVVLWNKKCSTQRNFNLGLDDQSADFFQCPINGNRIYRPESPLSAFNGDGTKGEWKLVITDDVPGEGGRLLEFAMEICSNVTLDAPYLVNNQKLQIPPGDKVNLTPEMLLTLDNNNTAVELIYTLVTTPQRGTLNLNGVPLAVGNTFTQLDINNGLIRFIHDGSDAPADNFNFTVNDGQGGWVSITSFEIEIDPSFPSGVSLVELDNSIKIYPNPTTDGLISIAFLNNNIGFDEYTIFDILGKQVSNGKLNGDLSQINMQQFANGVYLISLSNGVQTVVKKLIKQ